VFLFINSFSWFGPCWFHLLLGVGVFLHDVFLPSLIFFGGFAPKLLFCLFWVERVQPSYNMRLPLHFFFYLLFCLLLNYLGFPNFDPYTQMDLVGGLLENCCERNHLPTLLHSLKTSLKETMSYGVFQKQILLWILPQINFQLLFWLFFFLFLFIYLFLVSYIH
jgi:hypothetical protein